MREILWISLGAVARANARYFIARWVAKLISASFPYGTLLINVSGSFVLGFFLIWTTERVIADPRWRLLIAIGFCGSYTTFSSYAFESFAYLQQGHWYLFAANVLANNVLCLAAVIAGGFAIRRGDVDTGKLSIIGGAVIAAAPAIAFAFFKIFGLDSNSTVGVGQF